MSKELSGFAPVSLTRRRMIAGAAALGAVTVTGARMAQAQESPATPGADDDATGTDMAEATDRVSQPAERYQDFVSKLAANLGVTDAATIDTGIRDALKSMVDDRLNAGEIAANDATEWKTEIDESEAPIKVGPQAGDGQRGPGHRSGFGNDRAGMSPGTPPDISDAAPDSTEMPGGTGTPEATGAIIA